MADQEYHRQYWKGYSKRQISLTLTLTPAEYRQWEKAAQQNGVKIGQQIKAEAVAYRQQERVPDSEILAKLSELIRVLRGIGTNINQMAHHSNMFRKVINQRQTIEQLAKLELAADQFIRDQNSPAKG